MTVGVLLPSLMFTCFYGARCKAKKTWSRTTEFGISAFVFGITGVMIGYAGDYATAECMKGVFVRRIVPDS
jgi:hypothetical protein